MGGGQSKTMTGMMTPSITATGCEQGFRLPAVGRPEAKPEAVKARHAEK